MRTHDTSHKRRHGKSNTILNYTITKHTRSTTNRHKAQILQSGRKSGQDDLISNDTKTDNRREILLSSKVSRVEFLNSEMVVSGDGSGKTRFWNIKDGTEAQASVAGGGKFSFSKGASTKQQVGRHVITADGDMVLVHEVDGAKDVKGSAAVKESAAVACFRAPGRISVLDCAGDQIAVGCEDGHVLHLRAALLMQGASGHK
jgi:hypothetical protein